MTTYKDLNDFSYSDTEFKYQQDLTAKLDTSHSRQIDQELINEIVLWKINRFAQVDIDT